jgi:hypothetical protein
VSAHNTPETQASTHGSTLTSPNARQLESQVQFRQPCSAQVPHDAITRLRRASRARYTRTAALLASMPISGAYSRTLRPSTSIRRSAPCSSTPTVVVDSRVSSASARLPTARLTGQGEVRWVSRPAAAPMLVRGYSSRVRLSLITQRTRRKTRFRRTLSRRVTGSKSQSARPIFDLMTEVCPMGHSCWLCFHSLA